jgi:hypothetical protein
LSYTYSFPMNRGGSQFGSPYPLQTTTYPLDLVTGATGGWSTRKLAVAYAGNAGLMRRTSDSATQAVTFVGQVLNAPQVRSFAGLAGSATLQSWYDQSGNGRDISQATAGTQPLLYTSGAFRLDLGTSPALDFPTTAQMDSAVNASSFITTTAGTIFAVILADTTTGTAVPNGRCAWGQSGGNAALVFQNGVQAAAFQFGGGSYQTALATGLAVSTAYVVVWRHLSGNLSVFVNNGSAAQTVTAGTGDTLASPLRIGTCGGSSPWDGPIIELITYNTGLSDADVATVGAAMASPYGITWT